MNEVKIKDVKFLTEVRFYRSGVFADRADILEWTCTIRTTDNKSYIYVEDEHSYSTVEKFKDYVLNEVLDDLGKDVFTQLESIIYRI